MSYSEKEMTATELKVKYDNLQPSRTEWSQHPAFPMRMWREEVSAGDTVLGYWEWVEHQIEAED